MTRTKFALVAAFVAVSLVPLAASAQAASSTSALSATIRAQLLSDPRTADLSASQLDSMVALLTQEAQAKGITAEAITWRPQAYLLPNSASAAPSAPVCAPNDFLCLADEAYGFVGPAVSIAVLLGLFAIALIWILAEMLHHRRFGVHGSLPPKRQAPQPPSQA